MINVRLNAVPLLFSFILLIARLSSAHVYEVQAQFHGDNAHAIHKPFTYLILADIFYDLEFPSPFAANLREIMCFIEPWKKHMSKCMFV